MSKRADIYPEVALKLEHGFDYVVVDPEGEVGLLTTGAGLSMMLIDELRSAGLRPFNFLDIRTGGLRGQTTRLVTVLRWLAAAPKVRVLLVNMFGGITDMGEFSRLLVRAIQETPALTMTSLRRYAEQKTQSQSPRAGFPSVAGRCQKLRSRSGFRTSAG